nr:reverse transcriptase domain-containing protein [Tanacetum cinerariifolium]
MGTRTNTPLEHTRVTDARRLNPDVPIEQVGSVHMIQPWLSGSKRGSEVMEDWSHVPLRSIPWDTLIPSSDPVVITTMIASYRKLSMEVSTIKLMVEFPTEEGFMTVRSNYQGRNASLAAAVEEGNMQEIEWEPIPGDTLKEQKVSINPEYPDQPITIGADLSP